MSGQDRSSAREDPGDRQSERRASTLTEYVEQY